MPEAITVAAGDRRSRKMVILVGLGGLCLVAGTTALSAGAVDIPPTTVWQALLFPDSEALDPIHVNVVQSLRLPRLIMGACSGATLGAAGAALQGLMRNPLADPGLIGVSAGAALGAVTVIILAADWVRTLPFELAAAALPAAAFVSGLLTTLLVYRLAHQGRQTNVAILLLAGIAVNALVNALIGLGIFVSDDNQLRDFQFWTLGSLSGVSWDGLLLPVAMMALATAGLLRLSAALNGMALGENDARYLGFDVERMKRLLVVLVALGVGASVAVAGVIGFVGLIVPHLVRLMIGVDHRLLLPGSALLGAGLLVAADTLARLIVLPAELPIGIITSAIGGPFFITLLLCQRRQIAL